MKFRALLFILVLFLAPVAKAQQWSWVESPVLAGNFNVASATWFDGTWYCTTAHGLYRYDTLDLQWKLDDTAPAYYRLAATPFALQLSDPDGRYPSSFIPVGSKTKFNSGLTSPKACSFGSDLFALVAGPTPIYCSVDSGRTWLAKSGGLDAIAPLNKFEFYDLAAWRSNLYLSTNHGLLVSMDKGDSWRVVDSTWKYPRNIGATSTALAIVDYSVDEWFLHVTTDGTHWSIRSLPLPAESPLNLFSSSRNLYCDVGTIFASKDEGRTWSALTGGRYVAVHDSSILGYGPTIQLSTDNGTTWRELTIGFRDQYFFDPNVAFVSRRDTVVIFGHGRSFASADRKTWKDIGSSDHRQPLNLHDTLYAIESRGLAYAGDSPSQWYTLPDVFQSLSANTIATDGERLYAGINNTGFASPVLVRTSPEVWVAVGSLAPSSDSVTASATHIGIVKDTFYVVLGSQGGTRGVFRTVGLNGEWKRFDTGLPLDSITDFVHAGSDVVALTRSSGIYRLASGTSTWKSLANPSTESPDHLFAFGDTLFVSSGSSLHFRTHDTWSTITGVPPGDSVVAMFKHHGTYLVNTRHSGIYNLYPAEGSRVSTTSSIALTISPNPATNAITLSGLSDGLYSLAIIDAVGRTLWSVSREIAGGAVQVPVMSLASGSYWMQARSSNTNWQQPFRVAR